MKKIISSIFVLAALMLFSADIDAQSAKRIYNDAAAFNIKGHVKKVITYSAPVKGGAREKKEEWSFNPDGGIKLKSDRITFISRDAQGRLDFFREGEIEMWGEGNDEINISLDQKNFYWEWKAFDDGERYLDITSSLSVFAQLENSAYDEYFLREDIEHCKCKWDGKRVKEFVSFGELWGEYKWQRGSKEWAPLDGRGYGLYENYKYDAKGNVIKTIFQYGAGDEWTETYTYLKYDSHGNWIKRKVKSTGNNPSGNKSTIETRTITYYK